MTTVEQVALAALADLGEPNTGLVNAIRWVNERISQVASRRMKHRRKIGAVVLPAAITTGTITATNNSDLIVADATALAAWLNQDFTHAFLQLNNSGVWYRILNPTDTGLQIDQPFPATTTTAVSYRIVWRYVTLPVETAFLGTFTHDRLRRQIDLKSQSQLDMHFPDRIFVSNGPHYFSLFGEDQGQKIIEFYPYSTQAEYILFTYWEVPPRLEKEDIIPVPFTAHDLKTGVLADVYRYKAATSAEANMAAYFASMEARQEGRWDKALSDIMRRDRDVDDLVLLFNRPAPSLMVNHNAHTEVFFRGLRP